MTNSSVNYSVLVFVILLIRKALRCACKCD